MFSRTAELAVCREVHVDSDPSSLPRTFHFPVILDENVFPLAGSQRDFDQKAFSVEPYHLCRHRASAAVATKCVSVHRGRAGCRVVREAELRALGPATYCRATPEAPGIHTGERGGLLQIKQRGQGHPLHHRLLERREGQRRPGYTRRKARLRN